MYSVYSRGCILIGRKVSGVKERRKRDTKDLAGTQEQSAYNVREVNLENIFPTTKIYYELIGWKRDFMCSEWSAWKVRMGRLKAMDLILRSNCFCSGRSNGSIVSGSSG